MIQVMCLPSEMAVLCAMLKVVSAINASHGSIHVEAGHLRLGSRVAAPSS